MHNTGAKREEGISYSDLSLDALERIGGQNQHVYRDGGRVLKVIQDTFRGDSPLNGADSSFRLGNTLNAHEYSDVFVLSRYFGRTRGKPVIEQPYVKWDTTVAEALEKGDVPAIEEARKTLIDLDREGTVWGDYKSSDALLRRDPGSDTGYRLSVADTETVIRGGYRRNGNHGIKKFNRDVTRAGYRELTIPTSGEVGLAA